MTALSRHSRVIVVLLLALLAAGFIFPVPIPEISLAAEQIGSLGSFPVTNTNLAALISSLLLIVLGLAATRDLRERPGPLQNFVEAVIETLLGFVENVAGKRNGRKFFPLVATILLFVVVSNWLGLLPVFGTVGKVHEVTEHGHSFLSGSVAGIEIGYMPLRAEAAPASHESAKESQGGAGEAIKGVLIPFLRSANTDLNTPLALALVAIFFVEYWGFSTLGLVGYGSKFVNLKGGPIGIFIGIMELVSEVARIVSLTFRLFGNIFAGEVLVAVVVFLAPWVAILPFFALELFVGFIQGFIFATLTLVFATMAVASHGVESHGHGGHH